MSVFEIVIRGSCYTLVALTTWEATRGWLRHRDRYRADIFWVVGLLVVLLLLGDDARVFSPHGSAFGALVACFYLLQPFFLLRLVNRFRWVRPPFMWLTLVVAGAGVAVNLFIDAPTPGAWTLLVAAYFVVLLGYVAWAFWTDSSRVGGVTGNRLWFASLGTGIHALIALLIGIETLMPAVVPATSQLRQMLGLGVFGCYYVGLVAPRQLRAMWTQRELYQHIRLTTGRQPNDRVHEAAADLARAVGHGVASIGRAVLLFDEAAPDVLVTRATNITAWNTLALRPGAGLIGRALARNTPVVGAPDDLEPEVAASAARLGRGAWAVPLVTDGRRWGVLLVVQRYGSLFPDDELEFLSVVANHAAATLEQARLSVVEKELHLRTAEMRLRDSEVRFSQVLQSLRDYAVLVLDQQGHVTDWRAGAEALFGYAAPDIVGQSAHVLFALDPAAFGLLLLTAGDVGYVSDDRVCQRRDGSTFFASTTVRPIKADDSPSGFVVVVRDETERRALDQQLQHTQKMEAVGQLAGGVAHDFNNLVTAILGHTDTMAMHPAYDHALDEHLEDIRKIAGRSAGLTRRLLAFSRREVVQPRPMDLPVVVAELVPMLGRVLDKRIQLGVVAESPHGWTVADPVQIEQIVLNLAVNARDAMPGGGQLEIRTTALTASAPFQVGDTTLAAGSYVGLAVSDTGIGMDAATCARIFEPFFTTKERGRGTGLGLSTVYGIAKQVGGAVQVSSVLGQGTAFHVYLPAVAPPALPTAAAHPAGDRRPTSESILLVEDDDAIRRLMRSWLSRRGYEVIAAGDAEEALAAVVAHPAIDIVVTDVMMPGRSGPELVRDLRRTHADLPALYISGYAHDALATEGLLPSHTDFLAKPFSNDELDGRIRQILSNASSNRSRL